MKVSVLVMTYNHVRFITQALDSVLGQRTSFAYEVLISEDCSTDGTRDLVIACHKNYPETVRLLLSEHNLRSNQIVARGIQAARGDYVALLDGDDYWTAADKLQKQADFLDTHPECALCFHNATVVHEDCSRPPWNWTPADQPRITTLEDLWLGNYIATCSTMFRRGLFPVLPAWYNDLFPITDWPLHLLNAEYGDIGYINAVMGVYRYHSGGLYSPYSEERKLAETWRFYQVMNRNFNYRYKTQIQTAISKYFFEWAEEYVARGELAPARACLRTCLRGKFINRYIAPRRFLRLVWKLYKPFAGMHKRLMCSSGGRI
jgi:glycosyltransferase involved in cell wall biosynthesis